MGLGPCPPRSEFQSRAGLLEEAAVAHRKVALGGEVVGERTSWLSSSTCHQRDVVAESRTTVAPLTRAFARIITWPIRSTQIAWPGDTTRSCEGRSGPKAWAAMRTTSRLGAGPRPKARRNLRWPSHLIGRRSPEVVRTGSPTRSASTGTSPCGVRISVPAAKQTTSDDSVLYWKVVNCWLPIVNCPE